MSTTTCDGATWVEASAITPTAVKSTGFKNDISIISWDCSEERRIRTQAYHLHGESRPHQGLL
jgi:hypothetical protein